VLLRGRSAVRTAQNHFFSTPQKIKYRVKGYSKPHFFNKLLKVMGQKFAVGYANLA